MYAALAAEQLTQAYGIKASFEVRAVTLLTSAGALVTAVLAISALAGGFDASTLPALARILVGVAVVLFVVAIGFAFAVLRPVDYPNATAAGVKVLIHENWSDSEDVAASSVANQKADHLDKVRGLNNAKAKKLHWVVTCEFLAVAALAMAVVVALATQ